MSIFSEVIGAQQAQVQEPRNAEDQRLKIQEFLTQRALAQAQEQRDAQGFQMEFAAKQRAQQEADVAKQAQSAGLIAYQNYLKNPEMQPVQGGPNVNLVPGQAPQQAPSFSFDTVSRSILKNNPSINPQAFVAALKQFEPQFESADRMKLAQFQSLAKGAGAPQEQIYNQILKEQGPAAAQKWFETNKRANPEETLETYKARAEGKAAGELTGAEGKKQVSARDNISIIDEALSLDEKGRSLLDKATGSGFGALVAGGKQFVGTSDESTQANAALTVLGGRLLNNVPRMEGPQSNIDMATYKEQAGKLADPRIPAPDKKAALMMIRELSMKYANPDSGTSAAPSTTGISDYSEYFK